MRFSRLLVVAVVALIATGCTCTPVRHTDDMGNNNGTNNIGTGADNGPLKDINFAYDSYALTDTAKGILKSNADWLKANPSTKVQVEGHCDERGTNEYNMVLGANRAKSGMNYLKTLGVAASRMSTVSYGEQLPLDPASNEVAWAKNRRDHFKVD